jgi:hypothetical protein
MADLAAEHDVALTLLQMVQGCFGDIVRGKDHEGGALMGLIDQLLASHSAKGRLDALEAGARLAGTHVEVKALTYLDQRAVAVLEQAQGALKLLLPFARQAEDYFERDQGQTALRAVETLLKDTGNG